MRRRSRDPVEAPARAGAFSARSAGALCGGVAAALLLEAGEARASGFASARFGGEHGHVTTTNPTALYYNPAGIGLSDGVHLFVDGSLALRSVTWAHSSPDATEDPPAAAGANSGRAELLNVFGAPMLGASFDLGELALGAAVFVPFGGRTRWSENEAFVGDESYPRAADGVQRWHSIEGAITHLYVASGAAYQLGSVSVGATVNLIVSSVKSVRAKNFTGDTLPDLDNEGRATVDVSGVHASFGAGVLFEAAPSVLWLGASYQAQPGLGAVEHSGTLRIEDRGSVGVRKVTLHEALPDIVRIGARYRPLPALELRLSGDTTRWSVAQTTCIGLESEPCVVTSTGADPNGGVVALNLLRAWNDTYGVRAGVSYWPSPVLELLGGVGFETAATPDETIDPELPDAHNIAASLGLRTQIASRWLLSGSYTHIQYLARDTSGKSILTRPEVPTRRPDAGGRYEQWIGVVNVNLEVEF